MPSPFRDKHNRQLSWSEAWGKIRTRFYHYYLDLKLAKLWCLGYVPSHAFRRFVYRLAGVKIGKNSTIHVGARFFEPRGITIGQGTIIGDRATLDGRASLIIGDHVDIASEVMIFNSQHDIHHPEFVPVEKPVEVEDYVFIGPRAIILPGVKIGKGAIVAAGAVVTKDVPPLTVVGGVPAKEIARRRVEKLAYRLGRFRLFQ